MSSDSEGSLSDPVLNESEQAESESTKTTKLKPKRRTKTGCLTCRKRRIKCGEERPICKNCIKSKRECAGYNPPASNHKFVDQTTSLSATDQHDYHPSQLYTSNDYSSSNYHPGFGGFYNSSHNSATIPSVHHGELDRSDIGSVGYHSLFEPSSATPSQGAWSSTNSSHGFGPESGLAAIRMGTPFMAGTSVNENSYIHANLALQHQPTFHHNSGYHVASQIVRSGASHEVPHPLSVSQRLLPSIFPQWLPDAQFQQHVQGQQGGWPHSARREQDFDTQDPLLEDNLKHLQEVYPGSPLLNEQCYAIFRHFLDVTGPCMSIFDRLEKAEVPAAYTMVWTNGLPKMALRHPALAHAIIAISALHLSRLNHTSDEFAVEQFTCALQEVKVLLEKRHTRGHVATLATVLLLAYYEVITGDHARWSLHISGAARLIMEHDYAHMIRRVKATRKQAKSAIARSSTQFAYHRGQDLTSSVRVPQTLLDDRDWDVDQDTVSFLMGTKVDYDEQIQPDFESEKTVSSLVSREAEDFKILMEMYWWYCKQDLYQSMLSGDAPMLHYSKWKYCPPRGRLGVAEKPHATIDHLWLILARIMAFGFKDRKRKLRFIDANGGAYSPPPGFLPVLPMQKTPATEDGSQAQASADIASTDPQDASRSKVPPVANEGRARTAKVPKPATPASSGVHMYGFIPPPDGPVRMSSSFEAMEAELQKASTVSPPESDSVGSSDLDSDLQHALEEHGLITEALERFCQALSDDGFRQIPLSTVTSTPFGPAFIYSSATIANIWAFYFVARIMLRRMHPHSHPAAMIAAGMNAAFTAEDARMIGSIFAGLYMQYEELLSTGHVDHLVTAAVVECTFALLFAAVQYQSSPQRSWTVDRLKILADRTGWATLISVALACEATWSKIGEAGKGPPYVRTLLDSRNSDARLASDDSTTSTVQKDLLAGVSNHIQEHESRFVRHDRNLIGRHTSTRAYWAMGLLSVEDDLKLMNIREED